MKTSKRAPPPRGRPEKKSGARLAPEARRRQLLSVAAELVGRTGALGLQLTEVALAAGVSRPIVYRFFPNRHALIVALLTDFESELTARFFRAAAEGAPDGNIARMTRIFIDAICDTIEAKGVAGWHLLDSKGPDPEVARIGGEIQDRLLSPWLPLIAERTGASRREVATVTGMLVAAGRAVLELWYGGQITRKEAVRDATRGVSALLEAFSGSGRPRAERPR